MDFERYYLDLFDMLNACCKKIASGKYDASDSERLFELSKKGRYPSILAELAESFSDVELGVFQIRFRRYLPPSQSESHQRANASPNP